MRWKELLGAAYSKVVPHISKQRSLLLSKDHVDGLVVVKESSADVATTHPLMKPGADVDGFKAGWQDMMKEDRF